MLPNLTGRHSFFATTHLTLGASFTAVLLLNGCLKSSDSSQDLTGGTACDGVQLDASRQYKPKSWTDAQLAFGGAGSLTFAIPGSIHVTQGNAGNGKTKFTFSLAGGVPITCLYRGNGGSAYIFVKCKQAEVETPDVDDDDNDHDDGPADVVPSAGSSVTADSFTLHVNKGDKKSGTTAVSLHLGGPVISDDDLCTVDACAAGAVTHTPVEIDDHDDCTVDACDALLGTTHTAVDTAFCRGRANFNDTELFGLGGNGRACSTCHGESTAFQLSPADANARYLAMTASHVDDPLFRVIDANDFRTNGAASTDYTNLRNGLVRVTIPLPPNVRLLDCGSAIPCPASAQPTSETTADVWRSVPTVFNVVLTGPDGANPGWARGPNTRGGYQLDARVDTLQNQALGALHGHAQITVDPPVGFLDDVAAYQNTLLSAPPPAVLSDLEQAGKVVFVRSCGQCHGGPGMSTTLVTGRYVDIRTAYPRPVDTVSPPRWVFPPAPQLAGNVRTYEFTMPDGFKVRKTTTDPGRALLTGFVFSAATVPPAVCAHPPCGAGTGDDFQKLDMPSLHGISHTAPYFHNNSAATLEDVINHYDQLFLQLEATNAVSPVITSMPGLTPPVFDRPLKRIDQDGGVERTALLAYLRTL